jgi:hypothetical protein
VGYIFLDESGDLGFDFSKKKTSKYFIIACLYISDRKIFQRIIKNTFRGLPPKIKRCHCGVFHCVKENRSTRENVLTRLAKTNAIIFSIILHKKNVFPELHNQKCRLYNYITSILLDRIYRRRLLPKEFLIDFIASKRETNRLLNENFKWYLESKVNPNNQPKIRIQIMEPCNEKALQVADFACWSIFRAREHDDNSYRNIIRHIITGEGELFPHKKTKPCVLLK